MTHTPTSDLAARQVIDSITVFNEHRRVHAAAQEYAGGMYWKREGVYEYLVKTRAGQPQERLGRRDAMTEAICLAFHKSKTALETRQASLKEALAQAERLNKAVNAGQSPSMLVALLNLFEANGVADKLTVVGTHALYAYALAAGVRIQAGRATGLLWDARARVRFQVKDLQLNALFPMLLAIDPSLKKARAQTDVAINNKGFQVELLRQDVYEQDVGFEHPVIDVNGRMAMMRTLQPRAFASWIKQSFCDEQEVRQSEFVNSLLRERLLR